MTEEIERKSAKWMIQLDERILEHIEEQGWSTPKMMARKRGFPEYLGVISDRCKRLYYVGFMEPLVEDSGMYDITVEGRLYLKGEIDARHQPTPIASAVHKTWSFPPGWSPGLFQSRL
ncbi:hypothetical protein [Halorientalis halophila]|uniref:hypothetical protein n=1 Tax=Halorientalis halophila TaxID=3108499 RepID=UPI0030092572